MGSGKVKGFQTLGKNAHDSEVCPRARFARDCIIVGKPCIIAYVLYNCITGEERAARGARREKSPLVRSMGNQTQEHDANMHRLWRARAWSLQTLGLKRVCLLLSKPRASICAEEVAVVMVACVFAAASERVCGGPVPRLCGGPPHSLHSPSPPTRTPHAVRTRDASESHLLESHRAPGGVFASLRPIWAAGEGG